MFLPIVILVYQSLGKLWVFLIVEAYSFGLLLAPSLLWEVLPSVVIQIWFSWWHLIKSSARRAACFFSGPIPSLRELVPPLHLSWCLFYLYFSIPCLLSEHSDILSSVRHSLVCQNDTLHKFVLRYKFLLFSSYCIGTVTLPVSKCKLLMFTG